MFTYIGNGAYCYSNSTSMLLDTVGKEYLRNLLKSCLALDLERSGLKRTTWYSFRTAFHISE